MFLCNHSQVVEQVDSKVAFLVEQCKMNRFPAQFDIAEGKAFAYDPVLEYSPQGAESSQAFVEYAPVSRDVIICDW